MMKYRRWTITHNPKPIPTNKFDYDAVHDDYDGEGDNRAFSEESIVSCLKEIDEREGPRVCCHNVPVDRPCGKCEDDEEGEYRRERARE